MSRRLHVGARRHLSRAAANFTAPLRAAAVPLILCSVARVCMLFSRLVGACGVWIELTRRLFVRALRP